MKTAHKEFIYLKLGQDYSAFQVHRMLLDQDIWDEYGLPPISITVGAVYKFIHSKKFDQKRVDEARDKWRDSFDQIRLYHKQNRLLELQKIVHDPRTTTTDRIAALKAIKAEIGEDVDKMAEALKGSGTTNIIAVGNLDDSQQSTVRDNLKVAFRF